ncbi:neural Wiskott-Aldrich syndrome protein [Alligator mississippiensis]|uniref:Actin nucleation-promoting factor WASL n=1 Tax=Alligator mississippiensis TaxID=8496 RepID=A0A151PEW7_ALLMI|nr:neural Wiskott-Aldrich syndrome protein [Alligator mississippiensis]
MLLTPQENDSLFACLGKKCVTMSSAVVQIYAADRNAMWSKRCCGIACLVKDNPQRSYFIRIYDIKDGKLLWEQELYNNFVYNSPRGFFHTFAGDTCQVGLNFASEEEAKTFRKTVTDLLGRRQRKSEKRRDPPNGPNLPMATVDIKNPEITTGRFHNSQVNNISHTKEKKKGKAKKKRLTKADIGTPSNFQHIGHVGWDPNTGFDVNNLDPELKKLFDLCGISEAQLKDKETSKVIYDFIEKTGGVEAVKNELRRQGNKAALLDQIREGAQLKKVEQNSRPVSCSGRDALLDQIRQGIQLKSVSDGQETAPPTPAPTSGIVGALMEVMQKRSKAIHSSGESVEGP